MTHACPAEDGETVGELPSSGALLQACSLRQLRQAGFRRLIRLEVVTLFLHVLQQAEDESRR